ncbi:MAG TPA: hypothetical protein VGJ26_08945 [Pirellulales bacterium]
MLRIDSTRPPAFADLLPPERRDSSSLAVSSGKRLAAETDADRDSDEFANSEFDDRNLENEVFDDDADDEIPAQFDPQRWDDFGADFDDEEPEPERGDFWPEIDDEPL